MRRILAIVAVIGLVAVCSVGAEPGGKEPLRQRPPAEVGLGPDVKAAHRVELGRKLFFDRNLSADQTISCASCHRPDKAFSDGKPTAEGVGGRLGTRNTPSVIDAGLAKAFFWDGRREVLETQVLDPLFNPNEHGLRDAEDLLKRIGADGGYSAVAEATFGTASTAISLSDVGMALAAFLRSLNAASSPADRYLFGGDRQALTPAQRRGLDLFRGDAQCATCHRIGEHDALFTDHLYHSHSVGFDGLVRKLPELVGRLAKADGGERGRLVIADPDVAALGRFVVTLDPKDIGRFKTPSLRNVALTGPYMHDGSVATLDEAVAHEIYYRSRVMGRPLILTPTERQDLVEFLRALTSSELPD
jgi:cytochrome c peroxidase